MKPRSDSKLKTLPEERQEQIIAWARTQKTEEHPGGLAYAREQLAADGLKVSMSTLSEFVSWYGLQQRFAKAASRANQVADLLQQRNPDMEPEHVRKLAQSIFTLEALDSGDADTFVSLEHLKLAQDSAQTKADLERQKISISRQRLQILTCEKFLEWSADAKAREIAEGSGSRAEKIEALGRAMFAEDWD